MNLVVPVRERRTGRQLQTVKVFHSCEQLPPMFTFAPLVPPLVGRNVKYTSCYSADNMP